MGGFFVGITRYEVGEGGRGGEGLNTVGEKKTPLACFPPYAKYNAKKGLIKTSPCVAFWEGGGEKPKKKINVELFLPIPIVFFFVAIRLGGISPHF